ncbi:MAG TPA: hypothetical protein VFZ25_14385 [Chloroflexota bacterium]|nr:hypothetical protein [Chloroflexota bacterium]
MNGPFRARLLRGYLLLLGGLLLAQGGGSLLRRLASADAGWLINGLLNADPLHASIHILWGGTMLVSMVILPTDRRIIGLALVFGTFYLGFAILGVVIYHPLGMKIDLFENAFHWTVGPLTLGLGLAAARRHWGNTRETLQKGDLTGTYQAK